MVPNTALEPRRDRLFHVAARSPSTDPLWPPVTVVTGTEKNVGRPGLEPRSLAYRASTLPLSY